MSFKQQVCSTDSFYTAGFPPRNMKSSPILHWVLWQAHVRFPHFQQLNSIKINWKNIEYFSKVTSLWSNCFSHRGAKAFLPMGKAFLFLCQGKWYIWKKREAPAIMHPPRIPRRTLACSSFCPGTALFALALQAWQTATHSTLLWQMCSFLLHSVNSAWEGCKKKKKKC